jgi:hypothetical protein
MRTAAILLKQNGLPQRIFEKANLLPNQARDVAFGNALSVI